MDLRINTVNLKVNKNRVKKKNRIKREDGGKMSWGPMRNSDLWKAQSLVPAHSLPLNLQGSSGRGGLQVPRSLLVSLLVPLTAPKESVPFFPISWRVGGGVVLIDSETVQGAARGLR